MPVTAITLVCNPAAPILTDPLVEAAFAALETAGRVERRTLADGVAEDFVVAADLSRADAESALVAVLGDAPVDLVVQPASHRRKRLLIADMDSTIIAQECIDELADLAGRREEVAALTARAMRGELNFEAALLARVALLKGLTVRALEETLKTRITVTSGAATLVRTMNRRGAATVLVSGGFSFFVERIAARLGFQKFVANELAIEDDVLNGDVRRPILGQSAKEEALLTAAGEAGVALESCLAVGDGANDIGMIKRAGLGVAFRGKPAVAEAADATIAYADLTALLYAQGVSREEFAE